MVHFNMIDTVGRGIKKIYTEQRKRFFPMPDYEIDNEKRSVGVTIYGKMIDEKYTQLLKKQTTLTLKECLWLDAVQKNRPITLAQKAGKEGFKRSDAFDAVSHLLPTTKTHEQKKRFVGDLLRWLARRNRLRTDGKWWFLYEE